MKTLLLLTASCWALCAHSLHAATRYVDVGDRVGGIMLHTLDGSGELISLETPTVVVFWASWSPSSLTALADIAEAAPQGGIRWRILPVNVESPWPGSDTAKVSKAARDAGWKGPIFVDERYELYDSWGILAVPTIVVIGLGGIIDDAEHSWDRLIRANLVSTYFGAITDSVPGIVFDPASANCRARAVSARSLWRARRHASAIASLRVTLDSCVGMPRDAARLALWSWDIGDTTGGHRAVELMVDRGENAWTTTAIAAAHRQRRDFDAAARHARKAIAIDSSFAPAWTQLALASVDIGDTLSAMGAWEGSSELNKFDPDILLAGSRIEEGRGRLTVAAKLLRQALETRLRQRSD